MTTFIVILCLVGYVVVAGFTYQMIYDRLSGYDKEIPAFFGAVFWPLVGPIALGKSLAVRSASPSRGERRRRAELEEAHRRRRAELEEANHQEVLARTRLREVELTERAIELARKDSL